MRDFIGGVSQKREEKQNKYWDILKFKFCLTTETQQWTRCISSNVAQAKRSKIKTDSDRSTRSVLVWFLRRMASSQEFLSRDRAGIWQPFVLLCKCCIPNIPVWMHTERGMRVWLNVFHCVPKPLSMRLLAATHCDRVYVSATLLISVYLLVILSKSEASKNKAPSIVKLLSVRLEWCISVR